MDEGPGSREGEAGNGRLRGQEEAAGVTLQDLDLRVPRPDDLEPVPRRPPAPRNGGCIAGVCTPRHYLWMQVWVWTERGPQGSCTLSQAPRPWMGPGWEQWTVPPFPFTPGSTNSRGEPAGVKGEQQPRAGGV